MAKSTFTKLNGRSTFACTLCGRMTRDVDQGGTDLCPECYELCGMDNECNDSGRKPTGREQAQAAKLLAAISKKGGQAGKTKGFCGYLFFGDEPTTTTEPAKETTVKTKTTKTKTAKQKTIKSQARSGQLGVPKKAQKHSDYCIKVGKGDGMFVVLFSHKGDTIHGLQLCALARDATKYESLEAAKASVKSLRQTFRARVVPFA